VRAANDRVQHRGNVTMTEHPALSDRRVAVVTGAASGIGLAAAKRFAAMGLRICLADLGGNAFEQAGTEVGSVAKGGAADVVTVPTDVGKLEEVQRLKDRAYDTFGEVAILMNNAGTSPGADPSGEKKRSWRASSEAPERSLQSRVLPHTADARSEASSSRPWHKWAPYHRRGRPRSSARKQTKQPTSPARITASTTQSDHGMALTNRV
jgi:NAD(P)-dependent dehydrogenase (short-subunit alcohol dehydrogenase family)